MSGTPHTQPSTASTRFVNLASQSLVASTDAATAVDCAASGSDATVCSAVGAPCATAERTPPQKVAAAIHIRPSCAFMRK